jgi:hypothetical protein
MNVGIARFVDLRPSSDILKNMTFRKPNLFPTSPNDWETPTLLGPLELTSLAPSDGPSRLDVSHTSPEDGNRPSFWNIVLFCIL